MPDKIIIQTFVLDDQRMMLESIEEIFNDAEIQDFKLFDNQTDFFIELNPNVKICVIDYYLQKGVTGIDVMRKVLEVNPKCRIIVISAKATLEAVIDCNNLGPFPFLSKMDENFGDQLVLFIKKSIQHIRAEKELYNLIMNL